MGNTEKKKQVIQVTVQHQLERKKKQASPLLIRHFIISYKITLILKSCNIHM